MNGTVVEARSRMIWSAPWANAMPAPPPSNDSSTLSIMSARTRRAASRAEREADGQFPLPRHAASEE